MRYQHWNHAGGGPESFAASREVLLGHCEAIGRDPAEITMSSQVRFSDPAELPDTCAALGEVGCDLCIVYIPEPHRPATLEAVAAALRA